MGTVRDQRTRRRKGLGRRRLRSGPMLVAVCTLLIGCSSDDGDTTEAGAGTTADVTTDTGGGTTTGGTTTGVTDTTITISSVGSFSGPYAEIYEQTFQASTLMWSEQVNANGGIHGRMIDVIKVDDHFTVEGAVGACHEISSNGSFAAFTQSMFDNGLECLNDAEIPAMQSVINLPNPEDLDWTYIHAMFSGHEAGATLARYVASGEGLDRGGHKVGVIYASDNPSASATAAQLIEVGPSVGLEMYGEEITTNQTSFTAQLQRLSDEGVDTVVIAGVAEAIGILRDAAAIAYAPVFTGYLFNVDEVSLGGAAPLFQGISAPRPFVGADSDAFQAYQEAVSESADGLAATTTNFGSYSALLVLQQALELAGPDLTREGLLAAFDQIEDFDTGGYPPVSFGPGDFIGTDALFPLECCNADNTWRSAGASSNFG
jgi:branched-chain amino acid transport system substrate-binding protein